LSYETVKGVGTYPHQSLRRALFYPLNYGSSFLIISKFTNDFNAKYAKGTGVRGARPSSEHTELQLTGVLAGGA